MARKGKSHYIDSVGPDDNALGQGLKWLVSESERMGTDGVIAVWTKQILRNVSWSRFAKIFSSLDKDGSYKIRNTTLKLYTPGRSRLPHHTGPILVIYGGQELLDAVDGMHGQSDVLYIPFIENDYKDWAATWGADELNVVSTESTIQPESTEQQEPTSGVTLFALRSLTQQVNLSTGILNSSDYDAAVRTLETLHHMKITLSPEDIRRQLIRLDWNPKDAKSVGVLAEKISTGRRPKGTKGKADEPLWSYWQSKIK